MSKAMKYIKNLEAVGFDRSQAEAQVQMVLDALEDDLVTKSDFLNFQERVDARFDQVDTRFKQVDVRFEQIDARLKHIDARFDQVKQETKLEIKSAELRIVSRLGALFVSTVSVAVAILALIKR